MNELLLYVFISSLLFAPVGAAMYFLMSSIRILTKAIHGHDPSKRNSAITTIIISSLLLTALISIYYNLLLYFKLD